MDTRAEILRLLNEGLKPSQIATQLGISKAAVSKHIGKLRKEGLLPESLPAQREIKPRSVNPRGAPVGSKNALIHGAYETLWDDSLNADEKIALRLSETMDTPTAINRGIALCDIRIARILKRLSDVRGQPGDWVQTQMVQTDGTAPTADGPADYENTRTTSDSRLAMIQRMEEALDRVQGRRDRLVSMRQKLEEDARRFGLREKIAKGVHGGVGGGTQVLPAAEVDRRLKEMGLL